MIREAVREDAYRIGEIIVGAWQHAYDGIVDPNFPPRMSKDKFVKLMFENIEKGKETVFVYDSGEEVMGFISGKMKRDGGEEEWPRTPHRDNRYDCEVVGLYVKPGSQGLGIGGKLLESMKDHFRRHGCRRMIVWTLLGAWNNSFYLNHGGTAMERKKIEIGGEEYAGVGFSFEL